MQSDAFDAMWEPGIASPPPATFQRPRMIGTAQQEAFFDHLVSTTDNVVLEAYAGTGKSTTCREGMHRLVEEGVRASEIRYTAFNKSIADEFRARAPEGTSVGTFHSFCFRALSQSIGSPVVDGSKTYKVLEEIGGPSCKRYMRKPVAKLVSAAKNAAYDTEWSMAARYSMLVDLIDALDVETWNQPDAVIEWSERALERSRDWTSVVDFDDQLWLSYYLDVSFPSCDVLFVDECQDLNGIQHALLPRLNPNGRTVAVGDRFQSVYGFRGADVHSIPRLIEKLGATVLPLTLTFRCPKTHVELAKQWVPNFEAFEGNPDGEIVESNDREDLGLAQPGDQVLCRRNAPLVSAALEAIGAGRPAFVRGRAFGEALRPIIAKCDAPTIAQFVANVDRWHARKLAELADRDGAEDLVEKATDQAGAVRAVAGACNSPAEIDGAIKRLFDEVSASERITFSSIHRAKGTESRRIFLLDTGTAPSRKRRRPPSAEEVQQERNVSYVAHTRSLESLYLIHAG